MFRSLTVDCPKVITLFLSVIISMLQVVFVESLEGNFSDCYTLRGRSLVAASVEGDHLWWPAGVKWPTSPPNLVATTTTVTIMKKVNKVHSFWYCVCY